MKTSLSLIAIILVLTTTRSFAQNTLAMAFPEDSKKTTTYTNSLPVFEFLASASEYDLSTISKDMIGEHVLGQVVSEKLYLLDSKYTYEVPIVPGNPQTRIMVRKPVIYEAVKKVERHLKKSLKKGEITAEEASRNFNKVLDVAFNVLTAETTDFEKTISKTDDVVALTNLFTQRVKLIF